MAKKRKTRKKKIKIFGLSMGFISIAILSIFLLALSSLTSEWFSINAATIAWITGGLLFILIISGMVKFKNMLQNSF